MKTLTEKYQALKEGNFSKQQFLRDARLAHPNLITQFNGFNDAIKILKAKGLVHEVSEEYQSFDSEEELNAFIDTQVEKDKMASEDDIDYSEYIVFDNNTFFIGRTDLETGKEIVEPGQEIEFEYEGKKHKATVTNQEVGRDGDNLILSLHPETSINEASVPFERDVLDTISLNQVKKGIRYELEQMGVKSVKVSAEDWRKAKDKVRKNIEKDQNYYVHKLADIKPVKHDKRPDTMKEVPSVKNKDSQNKKNQKKVKDQHNQMEKVKINEFKKIIKKVILESLEEQEYSMPAPDFKESHRTLVTMLEKIVSVAEKVGQASEQERDALADDPDATTYVREVEEYLRKVYNAYLYGDRDAGRDDEIFREGVSLEAYDKMEGLSNRKAQEAVKRGSEIILRQLTEEGFDEKEVLDFLQLLITANYGIVNETHKIAENYDLKPIQALQETPAFERALRSEEDFANFIKSVQADLWNYMADHFDSKAGAAPDELEEATKEKEYEVDGLRFYTVYNPPKGYYAKGVGEAKGQISFRYFDTEEQAKEHGELELHGYLSND